MNNTRVNFASSYNKLEQLLQQLESQKDEVNIDKLVDILDEANKAYDNCKNIISKVEKQFNAKINEKTHKDNKDESFF